MSPNTCSEVMSSQSFFVPVGMNSSEGAAGQQAWPAASVVPFDRSTRRHRPFHHRSFARRTSSSVQRPPDSSTVQQRLQ